jgi:hypothetical protein
VARGCVKSTGALSASPAAPSPAPDLSPPVAPLELVSEPRPRLPAICAGGTSRHLFLRVVVPGMIASRRTLAGLPSYIEFAILMWIVLIPIGVLSGNRFWKVRASNKEHDSSLSQPQL